MGHNGKNALANLPQGERIHVDSNILIKKLRLLTTETQSSQRRATFPNYPRLKRTSYFIR
jgi:hypothetical protein